MDIPEGSYASQRGMGLRVGSFVRAGARVGVPVALAGGCAGAAATAISAPQTVSPVVRVERVEGVEGVGWGDAGTSAAEPEGSEVPTAGKPPPPTIRAADGGMGVARIEPAAIQRVVRARFDTFRKCYEDGLRANPNLEGTVAVRFVIDREGYVASAIDGGSTMPDSKVVDCVVRGYTSLVFPKPKGGIVTVVYPIIFNPGDD